MLNGGGSIMSRWRVLICLAMLCASGSSMAAEPLAPTDPKTVDGIRTRTLQEARDWLTYDMDQLAKLTSAFIDMCSSPHSRSET